MKGKKILSAAVSCAMLFGAVSVTAFADEAAQSSEIAASEVGGFVALADDQTPVTDEIGLRDAIADGANIVLQNNIDLEAGIDIPSGCTVTIDLGGNTLNGADETYAIRALGSSTLTVTNGTIYVGEYEYAYSYGIDNRGGNVTVESVTFTGTDLSRDSVTANLGGTTTLKDVTVKNAGGVALSINSYNDANSKLIIESGSYGCDIAAWAGTIEIKGGDFGRGACSYGGTIEIKGGDFSRDVCSYGGTINISDGTISKAKSGDSYDYGTVNISGGKIGGIDALYGTMNVNGGDFSSMTYIRGWNVPEGWTIGLNNAEMLYKFSMESGTLSGTVSKIVLDVRDPEIYLGADVSVEDGVIDSIQEHMPTGYVLEQQSDGSYKSAQGAVVTIYVKTEDKNIGRIGIKAGETITDVTVTKKLTVTKGKTVSMLASNIAEGYVFDGWYKDDGQTPVSTDNPYTVSVEPDATDNITVTYTAKAKVDTRITELENATKAWLYEEGTTNLKSSYDVSSKEEMKYLAYAVNEMGIDFKDKTVNLTKDLDYSAPEQATLAASIVDEDYTPIGTEEHPFAGTFNGQNKWIRGIVYNADDTRYVGIFGNATGEIMNLNVSDCSFSDGTYVGVIAGEGRTFTGCHVEDSKAQGAQFVGIIAGHSVRLNATNVSVSNCTVDTVWKGGAVAGYADNCTITNANVTGITLSDNDFKGSLVGHINSGQSTLTNIQVNAPDYPLIGTTYSGDAANKSVTITGDETDIDSKFIIDDFRNSQLYIQAGAYNVSDDIINMNSEVTEVANIKQADGTYTKNNQPASATILNGGGYTVVSADSITETITVEFVQREGTSTYDIVLKADEGKDIYRFTAAELAFTLELDDGIAYVVEGAENINVSARDNGGKTGYMFNFNGVESEETGSEITIGSVTFTGVGQAKFSIDADYTDNIVNTAKFSDSIVDTYVPNGGTDVGDLNISNVIDLILQPETSKLTVNVTFPNEIKNNPVAYQKMWAEITGGTLTQPIVFEFGSDNEDGVTFTDQTYTFTVDLVKDRTYTVAIKGEGYRTARYTVNMTADKTLSFWNNVMDTAQYVETITETQEGVGEMRVTTYLAGDIVMNNVIDIYDLSAVVAYFGTVELNGVNAPADANDYIKYDLNRDGKIDSKDVAMVLVSWGK